MGSLPIDDQDAALYSVGQVADMLAVQQAYLRRLDEQQVVSPARSSGGQRRYSRRQIDRVQRVTDLAEEGISLAGARRVLMLEDRVAQLEAERDAAQRDATGARAAMEQLVKGGDADQRMVGSDESGAGEPGHGKRRAHNRRRPRVDAEEGEPGRPPRKNT